MLTLGFTNHFYTLWNVTQTVRYGRGEVVNGIFNGESWLVTKYTYYRNLSMDYEVAKAKITAIAGEGNWEEDLSLRGEHGSFERTVRQINALAEWQFTFGRLFGTDMRTATDVWQLRRAMKQEESCRRQVYARRRLIELGELVRYDWIERVFNFAASEKAMANYDSIQAGLLWNSNDPLVMIYDNVKRKYATPNQVKILERQRAEREMSGHFFTDGEKVVVKIKQIDSFSFETQFGVTVVVKYLMENGKIVKYMGANPPSISAEEFVEVKATVKHTEYKGVAETKLQRIKVK